MNIIYIAIGIFLLYASFQFGYFKGFIKGINKSTLLNEDIINYLKDIKK